ncbi:phage-associated hyaluronidase-like protein [Caudoviricetes sp.]|nr:phage-associated hyaluronidase-like protein [Caudoviricetes sp.]
MPAQSQGGPGILQQVSPISETYPGAVKQKTPGSPWLYSEETGDIVGVKDPDSSEFYWQRSPLLGVFMDLTTQSDGATPLAMTFNTPTFERGIRVVDGSKIYVDRTAMYCFQLSVHLDNSDSQAHTFSMWGKLNGENLENSRFIYTVPSSHGGVSGTLIPSQNFFVPMAAGDYIEIMWSTDSALVTIATHAAETSPAKPAAPALLLTVDEVAA